MAFAHPNSHDGEPAVGTVWLVGSGPGDPGLLTVRGRDLLRRADCVVYDALVSTDIMALANPAAVCHFVGKRGGGHSATQAEINALLVTCARAHVDVVRLKGGDPFVFGRGGEEAMALAAAHIPFAVVPGVTAGVAVPACAGIPITHRAASSAVAFVTGHEARDGGDGPVDWSAVARIETLVLYMGMHRLAESSAALIAAGRSPDTPAAVIQWGTRPEQRTCVATLATIATAAAAAGLGAPAITVIGDVVRYREHIAWFDRGPLRPLHGCRIALTRAAEANALECPQADDGDNELHRLFTAAGARVVAVPLARYVAVRDPAALDQAIRALAQAATAQFSDKTATNWLAFTSTNGVRFFMARVQTLGGDSRWLSGARIAAVGPGTAKALRAFGLRADLVPEHASDGSALARALITAGSKRVLLPQSAEGRPELAAILTAHAIAVEVVSTYAAINEAVPDNVDWASIDAIPLSSAATVQRLVAALGRAQLDAMIATGCRFTAMGGVTAAAMREHAIPVHAQATQPSLSALAKATISAVSSRSPAPSR